MLQFRKVILFFKRVRNRLSSYYNRFRLKLYGVSYGRNCVIHGKLYIRLFSTASLTIGDDFYASSGWAVNALCTNKRGCIYATEHATIQIGNNVGMSSAVLWAHKSISIGNNVKLGANTILIDTDAHNLDYLIRRDKNRDWGVAQSIVIKDDAFIGLNCVILKGVTVGERSVVAAGSVVVNDVPDDCLVAGNPAKVIRYLN